MYKGEPQPVYAYDQTWAPPPVAGSDDPNAKYDYKYDPVHTKVSYITVEQWNQIENDKSPYSYLWTKGEFTPEKFANNQKKEDCLDKGWMIAFWINFLISLVFMIVLATVNMAPKSSSSTSQLVTLSRKISNEDIAYSEREVLADSDPYADVKKTMIKAVLVGIGCGLALTLVHFAYMAFTPRFYIKFGLWVGVLITCAFLVFPIFITPDEKAVVYTCLAFAALVFLIAICVYCCCLRGFIEFTCLVFERAMEIEKSHPAIFLVIFIQIIIEMVCNVIYACAFGFIYINQWHYAIYIYYVFSYYWAISTNYYVFYLISANLAANCYFLEGTEFFPTSPIWSSVKRSMSKTFGSAAFAGFIAAVMSTLEHLAEKMMDSNNPIMKIIGCIAYCILCCLQAMFHYISRYGLFYVTVYNVPFLEGARRFTEISCKKFITTYMGESILSTSLTFNSFIFGVISIAVGLLVGISSGNDNNKNLTEKLLTYVFYPLFVIMFTEVFLWCLLNPADTITYSLFICFTEFPERLKVVNQVHYEFFVYRYSCCTSRATGHQLPPRPASLGPE